MRIALCFGYLIASLFRLDVAMHASQSLDSFDRAILAILQKDNTTPQRVIGEAVNLSAPAVQRRIKRMEESGVIRANVALVDPAKVGHPITLFVEVEVESERAELIDAAKRGFAEVPEVQRAYGASDCPQGGKRGQPVLGMPVVEAWWSRLQRHPGL